MKTPKPLQETNEPPFNWYVGRWVEIIVGDTLHYGRLDEFNAAGRWFAFSPYVQSFYAGNGMPYRLILSQGRRTVRYSDQHTVTVSPYGQESLEALIQLREKELAPLLHEYEESLRQFEERRKTGFR